MNILFQEEQQFRQTWVWALLIGVLFLVGILPGYLGLNMGISLALTLPALLILGIMGLFLTMKLTTTITKNAVTAHFFPLLNKSFRWEDIEIAEVLDYGFVGGWGIRLFTSYGTVYNVSGSKGLAITLKNGKRYVIGTQKEEEMRKVVEEVFKE